MIGILMANSKKKKTYEKVEDIPKEGEVPKTDTLKATDTLPSEADPQPRNRAPKAKKAKSNKIIGLMGIEHDTGPPGSTHG